MEWLTRMNSMSKGPITTLSLGRTVSKVVEGRRPNSESFSSMSPMVRAVPYIGAFTSRKTNGSAPVWSSWPWVITKAFTFSLFFLR